MESLIEGACWILEYGMPPLGEERDKMSHEELEALFLEKHVPSNPDVETVSKSRRWCRGIWCHALLCNFRYDIALERNLKHKNKEGGLEISRLLITGDGRHEQHGLVASQRVLCFVQYLWQTVSYNKEPHMSGHQVRWVKIKGYDVEGGGCTFKWLQANEHESGGLPSGSLAAWDVPFATSEDSKANLLKVTVSDAKMEAPGA